VVRGYTNTLIPDKNYQNVIAELVMVFAAVIRVWKQDFRL
jgi:hypothetical protein